MKLDIIKIRADLEALERLTKEQLERGMFCDRCGETNPPNHFYPLFHYPSVSGVTCNECYLTDEQYVETFHETKAAARLRCQNTR